MAALAIATPSGIGTPADDDRTQLLFVFGWVCVLAAAFGLVHAISAVLLDSAVVAALRGIHGLLAITAAFAHRQVRADRLERGVETMIAGLLLAAVAWSVFMPNLRDVAALGPIVALSLAIPYRRGPQLAAVVGAAIVTTIAIVTLGSFRVAPASPYEAIRFCRGKARPAVAPPLNWLIGVSPASLAFFSTASSSARVLGGWVMPICVASFLL